MKTLCVVWLMCVFTVCASGFIVLLASGLFVLFQSKPTVFWSFISLMVGALTVIAWHVVTQSEEK